MNSYFRAHTHSRVAIALEGQGKVQGIRRRNDVYIVLQGSRYTLRSQYRCHWLSTRQRRGWFPCIDHRGAFRKRILVTVDIEFTEIDNWDERSELMWDSGDTKTRLTCNEAIEWRKTDI
jgi:hypothetical protein